ncbi:MAG: homoserine kinase [Planctomycetes bacterium]|nr:homoserine kinase [Planctomycetota bacterium]
MFTPIRIVVPCSTSNLGPGFDCLGLALERFLTVLATPAGASGTIDWTPPGGTLAEAPLVGEERVTRAIRAAAGEWGIQLPGVRLTATSTIPVARGLGSSGGATVAGLVVAHVLANRAMDVDAMFRLGMRLEGHPDNIGPALAGGCTVAMPTSDGDVVWHKPQVHPDLRAAVAVPRSRLETSRARKALPANVTFAVARDQARRIAQLIHGLATAERKYLQIGMMDELHTPYRAPLIPGCRDVIDAAMRAGAFGAAISGSGSAMIALGNIKECDMQQIAKSMAGAFERAGEAAEWFVSNIPRTGWRTENI